MLMKLPRWGFWCECWTESLTEQGPSALVASFDAYFAPQVDRWVAVALETISPALDADASSAAWEWMYDGRIDTRRALHGATSPRRHTHHLDEPTGALPAPRNRQGTELPACAHDFTPRPEE